MTEIKNGNAKAAGTSIIVNQTANDTNSVGTAGFVLALIALFLGWIPIMGWILWTLGLILSFVGIFKKPKGLAIAGMVISFLWLILLSVIFSSIKAALSF